jgi:1-acyl-sn-glycerol-3-phosphate acyltransferase
MQAVEGYPRQSAWFRKFVLPFLRVVTWPFFTLLGPMKVVGRYRVPRRGGVLILANHISDADPPFLQLACPRATHFMGKSELFSIRFLGPVIRFFGGFPVKRGEPDRASLRYAMALLEEGEAVSIFPEGEASETGELLPLKPGIALIARQTGAPVICCGIRGTNRVIPYRSVCPRPAFGGVRAEWGEVRTFSKEDSTEDVLAWVEGQFRELTGQVE